MGAGPARAVDQRLEQVVRALRALPLEHGVERLEPLPGLLGIGVGRWGSLGISEFRGSVVGGQDLRVKEYRNLESPLVGAPRLTAATAVMAQSGATSPALRAFALGERRAAKRLLRFVLEG